MQPHRSRASRAAWLTACLVALLAPPGRADAPISAEEVVSGLAFPVFVTAPTGDGRLFVVERGGRIRIALGGNVLATPFLDISPQVSTLGERGLLGLAFDPEYSSNGLFYVYFLDLTGASVVARFRVSEDPDRADPDSQENLLVVPQPFANHNGGTIAFGPDGFLYLGLGDGGFANDPGERAQDPRSLLGKMLRFDASGGPGTPLGIPVDNPYVDDPDVRGEIWASGLRNPYRWSFDRETGDLWIADVGQGRREEVDFEPAGTGGRNYGWDVMEGSLCNADDPAPAPPCHDASLTLPIFEYPHVFGLCSITGGSVYRGAFPAIRGLYFFGDFCTGTIWSFERATAVARVRTAELAPAAGLRFRLVGFGEGGSGELYVVHSTGSVYRIRSPAPACSDGFDDDGDGLVDAEDPACTDPTRDDELPRNDLRVDVRPTALQPRSRGVVPVSVRSSPRYDLGRADPDTLAFGPAAASRVHGHGPHPEPLDADGIEDWTVHFPMQGSGLAAGDSRACVRLEIARVPFEGCDAVRIPPGASREGGSGASPPPAGVLRYVEPFDGCVRWIDCGWLGLPAP